MRKRKNLFIVLAVVLLVIVPLESSFIGLAVDWLFFAETGYTAVFTRSLAAKVGLGALFGLVLAGFVLVNAVLVRRAVFPRRQIHFGEGALRPFSTDQTDRFLMSRVLAGAGLLALTVGQWGAYQWQEFLLFTQGQRVGTADPILGKDLGFYLFTLPFIESIKGFSGFTLVITTFITALLYFLRGGIVKSGRGISLERAVKRHLAVLVGLILVNTAFGFYLDTFRLLFSEHGAVYGAGYADVHARLPVYRALAMAFLAAAPLLASRSPC